MKYYDDWESLVAAAQNECSNILKDDVAPVVKDILRRHIKSDIYDVYTPKTDGWVLKIDRKHYIRTTYDRRHKMENNLISILSNADDGGIELLVTTRVAPQKPIDGSKFDNSEYGAFLNLLETGRMGLWRKGFPRPAVTKAQKEINKSSDVKNAIKKGIEKRFM